MAFNFGQTKGTLVYMIIPSPPIIVAQLYKYYHVYMIVVPHRMQEIRMALKNTLDGHKMYRLFPPYM